MPRKLLPKPTLGAGPSGDGGGPSGALSQGEPPGDGGGPSGALSQGEPSGDGGGPSGALSQGEPSGDVGEPSGALSQGELVQLMARFDLKRWQMPVSGKSPMSYEDFLVVYAGWHLYAVCRRRVLPKEIQGIMRILTGIDNSGREVVNKLEDPKFNGKMSKVLNALRPEVKWTLTDRVDVLFRELLEDTKVRAIHLQLIGL